MVRWYTVFTSFPTSTSTLATTTFHLLLCIFSYRQYLQSQHQHQHQHQHHLQLLGIHNILNTNTSNYATSSCWASSAILARFLFSWICSSCSCLFSSLAKINITLWGSKSFSFCEEEFENGHQLPDNSIFLAGNIKMMAILSFLDVRIVIFISFQQVWR